VHGDRAGEPELRRLRHVAGLDDVRGGGEAHVRVDLEPVRRDRTLQYLRGVVVVEHVHADRDAERLLRGVLGGSAAGQQRRRLVERAVRAHVRGRLAAREHLERAARDDRAAGVDPGRVVVLDVPERERAHELLRGLLRLRGLDRVLERVLHARAGHDVLQRPRDVELDAQQLLDEAHRLRRGDLALGVLVGGDAHGDRVRIDARGRVEPQLAPQRLHARAVEDFDRGVIVDEARRDEYAGLRLDVQYVRRLARRDRGGADVAVRDEVGACVRLDPRAVPDGDAGVDRRDRERDRELQAPAGGLRVHARIGQRVEHGARAGVDLRAAGHGHGRASHGDADGERHDDLQHAVRRLDVDLELARRADRTPGDELPPNVDDGVADLQNKRIEIDRHYVRDRHKALVELQAREHVDRLGGDDPAKRRNLDLPLALRLVEAHSDGQIVLRGVVVDDLELSPDDHVVGADRVHEHVFAGHAAGDLDVAAQDHDVQAGRGELHDLDAARLVRGLGDDVREQHAARGNRQRGFKVDRAVGVALLALRAVADDLIVRKRERLGGQGLALELDRALVLELVRERVDADGRDVELPLEAQREQVARDVAQERDLGERLDGDLDGTREHPGGDPLGDVPVLVELAGQVQPVEARVADDVGRDAAQGRKRRGHVDGQHIVARAANEGKRRLGAVEVERRDVVDEELYYLLREAQRAPAGDRNPVAPRAARDRHVRGAEVYAEAVADRTQLDVRRAELEIGRVDELELGQVVSEA